MTVWRLPLLLFFTPCLTSSSIPPDLDVGIPPGSPIRWGQQFPALMPRNAPLIPLPATTARLRRKQQARRNPHTFVPPRNTGARVRMPSSFGVLRILTWDIGGHLAWVRRQGPDGPPVTGTSKKEPRLPTPDHGLYWACISPFLRLLLHPRQVSETEVIAHLVEIGDPVAAVLDNVVAEPSLREAVGKVRAMIAPGRRGASPLPGKTPRETMLHRFVAEELVREFPYDPEGGFGRRLFLFGEEVLPILIAYATHEDSFLRRNATTALSRYRTRRSLRALNAVAVSTKDPVCLMRSLAALGEHRTVVDAGALLGRLAKASNAVEEVAILVALGRCHRREAIPKLLEFAADSKNLDRRLAALTALVRIRFDPEGQPVRKLADRISQLASKMPSEFMGTKPSSTVRADVPDHRRMRAMTFEQMALLLRVRLDRTDAAATKKLLALTGKKARRRPDDKRRRARRRGRNILLNQVMPAVQMLYVETLRELGKKGMATLEKVAVAPSLEPALRGNAMLRLPADTGEKIALRVLGEAGESAEVQIQALKVLLQSGSSKLIAACDALLQKCARQKKPELASPQHRYLWLQALRILGQRNALDLKKLEPLLKYVGAARDVDRPAIRARIKSLIRKLTEDEIARKRRKHRSDHLKQILDLVIENKLRPYITEKTRAAAIAYINKQLEVLRARGKDFRQRDLIRQSLLNYLTGGEMSRFSHGNVELKPVVLLEEEILFAIGRLKTKEAADTLVKVLANPPSATVHAHACLALGLTGEKSVAGKLVRSLVDEDGFVRFCAYEALRELTGQEFWADWMYGDRAQWVAAGEKYMRWLGRKR